MSELKKHIYDEKNGLHYTLIGDYYMVANAGYVYIRIVFFPLLHMFGIMIIMCILMMLLDLAF